MSIGAVAILVTLATAAVFTLMAVLYISSQHMDLEEFTTSRNHFGTRSALATMVASSMGAWILFSPPEAGSAFGGLSAVLGYGIASTLAVVIFVVLGPRLRRLMPAGHSLTEYARHRYGLPMQGLTEAVMLLYMFVYLAAELTAIAKALQLLANVPLGLTALVIITAVFIYTLYGGLRASIYTDRLQFFVIVPLLMFAFGAAIFSLGGWDSATDPVVAMAPTVADLGDRSGVRFGWTLIIAIGAAEIFNQGNWQRVYACKSDRVLRNAFLGAAFLFILPMVTLAGLLGIFAVQFGISGDTAYFQLLQQLAVPAWFLAIVMVLAVALVMSSMDTLLNGMGSLFTLDLVKLLPRATPSTILKLSRILTVLIGLPAVWIASQGYSVLYIFLIADLVCAGVVFPLLFGLYSRHVSGINALVSSVIGIATGVLFFPKPDFSPLVTGLPGAGDLLVSFGSALASSVAICWVWIAIARALGSRYHFDFKHLREDVQIYGAASNLRSNPSASIR